MVKSPGVSVVRVLPSLSTTATSTVTRSTRARKTGVGCCCGPASVSEATTRLMAVRMDGSYIMPCSYAEAPCAAVATLAVRPDLGAPTAARMADASGRGAHHRDWARDVAQQFRRGLRARRRSGDCDQSKRPGALANRARDGGAAGSDGLGPAGRQPHAGPELRGRRTRPVGLSRGESGDSHSCSTRVVRGRATDAWTTSGVF